MTDKKRTALLVRCSVEEAQLIHEAANQEHRTLNRYVLNVVMSRIQNREKLIENIQEKLQNTGRIARDSGAS
jgi:uncharacterized protein (DUF1778 family)